MTETTSARALELLRTTRKNVQDIFLAQSAAQLDQIPAPLNNNIAWNVGHVVATLELLVYGLSGNKTPSSSDFINRFRKGSYPEGPLSAEDRAHIEQQLLGGIDQLEQDLQTLDFSNYKEYTTSYGVTLRSVEDALAFNNMHEALHLGSLLALRRMVA